MKNIFSVLFFLFSYQVISQCETFDFWISGYEPAYCRISSLQTGNGVVYAAATGGSEPYTYLWTNLQTGSTTTNTTWGGLNVGYYEIRVTDQMGCVLIDTLRLADSLNPIADFKVLSNEIDSMMTGNAPVEFQVVNTSQNVGWIGDPLEDEPIFWSIGNCEPYFARWDVFQPQQIKYYSESEQEVCLAISNSQGCVDTTCKVISVKGYAETDTVNIFPNPAIDDLRIEAQFGFTEVIIFSESGAIEYFTNPCSCQNMDINLIGFASGVYVIRISNANQYVISKFVKL